MNLIDGHDRRCHQDQVKTSQKEVKVDIPIPPPNPVPDPPVTDILEVQIRLRYQDRIRHKIQRFTGKQVQRYEPKW